MSQTRRCFAMGCDTIRYSGSKVKLHAFPRNESQCLKWMNFARNPKLWLKPINMVGKTAFLCEKYFSTKQYEIFYENRLLRRGALPSDSPSDDDESIPAVSSSALESKINEDLLTEIKENPLERVDMKNEGNILEKCVDQDKSNSSMKVADIEPQNKISKPENKRNEHITSMYSESNEIDIEEHHPDIKTEIVDNENEENHMEEYGDHDKINSNMKDLDVEPPNKVIEQSGIGELHPAIKQERVEEENEKIFVDHDIGKISLSDSDIKPSNEVDEQQNGDLVNNLSTLGCKTEEKSTEPVALYHMRVYYLEVSAQYVGKSKVFCETINNEQNSENVQVVQPVEETKKESSIKNEAVSTKRKKNQDCDRLKKCRIAPMDLMNNLNTAESVPIVIKTEKTSTDAQCTAVSEHLIEQPWIVLKDSIQKDSLEEEPSDEQLITTKELSNQPNLLIKGEDGVHEIWFHYGSTS